MAKPSMKLPAGAQLVDDQSSINLPPGAELVPEDSGATPALDLSKFSPKKDNKEGLYQMTLNGTDYIPVPYSKVMDAYKAGLKIKDEDQLTYARDLNEAVMKQRREHPMNASRFAPAPGAPAGSPTNLGLTPATDIPESVSGGQEATPVWWQRIRQGINEFGQPRENQGIRNFARRFGADLFGLADFPVQASGALIDSLSDDPNISAAGMDQLGHMIPPQMVIDRIQEFKNDWKQSKTQAVSNLTADAMSLLLAHKIGKAAKTTTGIARGEEGARTFVRSQLGMPERIEKTVKKFGEESEKARNDLRTARQKTAEQNIKDVREHEELKKNVAEKNEAAKRDAQKRADTQQKLDTASAEQEKKYEGAKVTAKALDDKAWDGVRSATAGKEANIQPLKNLVETAKKQADPATSAIFKSILNEGEEEEGGGAGGVKRDKLGRPIINGQPRIVGSDQYEFPVTHPKYAEMYEAQYGEEPPPPPEVKPPTEEKPVVVDGKEIPASDPSYASYYEKQYGIPPPLNGGGGATAEFSRLHRWYSFLSDRLYGGGRLEPGTYNALKSVLDGVDAAMQDIAKQAGDVPDPNDPAKMIPATKLLENARKIHTERMETFSDSPNEPATVASKSLQETNPEYAKEQAQRERREKVAKYDPSILSLGQHIDNLRAGLAALPKETPETLNPEVPPPPPSGIAYAGPEHPVLNAGTVASNPLPKEPKEGAPPPFGDRKAVGQPPDITKINQENIEYLNDALRRYGKIGPWVFRLIVGNTVEAFTKGQPSALSGALGVGQAALILTTKILRGEGALEWLARPSAEDMKQFATLPPKDAARLQQAFKALAAEEVKADPKKASTKISPAAAIAMGLPAGTTAAGLESIEQETLDQLKKEAEQLKPTPLPPPGPVSSAKPYTHIYDPARNVITAV